MKKLTIDHIIEVHDLVIEETGGHPGLRNKKDIEMILDMIEYPVEKSKIRSLVHVSAQLLKLIIMNHPFVDGNKRTALTVMLALLKRNNYKLKATKTELEKFIWKIAKGGITETDEIEYWIFQRLKKVSKSGDEI
jgi:death-on-curing protein